MPALDISSVRAHFPALAQAQVFFDNAGGSQILGEAADSIRDYLLSHNVQLGATYKVSAQSTDAYYTGFNAAAEYVNAKPDEIGMCCVLLQLFPFACVVVFVSCNVSYSCIFITYISFVLSHCFRGILHARCF